MGRLRIETYGLIGRRNTTFVKGEPWECVRLCRDSREARDYADLARRFTDVLIGQAPNRHLNRLVGINCAVWVKSNQTPREIFKRYLVGGFDV